MSGRINGFTVGYTAVGGIVLWSGMKGASLSDTFQALLKGQAPPSGETIGTPQLNILDNAGGSGSPSPGGSPSSSNIVNDARTYIGNRYVWGGTPGTQVGHDNGTDCSGFVNMVIGRDLGGAIPGYKAGQYKGATHGPVTGQWLLWGGAKTVSSAQPGDLACWLTHIGIFTDNGQHVISALDTKSGVVETTLAGATPSGEKLTIRRLSNMGQTGSNQVAQYGGTLQGGGY